MQKKNKSIQEIIEAIEDLHAQEDDLLQQLKDNCCELEDMDDDLDADFDEEDR